MHIVSGSLVLRVEHICLMSIGQTELGKIIVYSLIINAIIEAPPPQFIFFYFLSQIRRSLRLSVCAFYIRVEALYTLKHHSAESVTSDFFIADPKAC